MAEGAGFEPAIRFPVYTLSRRAPSTTRPPLRRRLRRGRVRCEAPKACSAGTRLDAARSLRRKSSGPGSVAGRHLASGGQIRKAPGRLPQRRLPLRRLPHALRSKPLLPPRPDRSMFRFLARFHGLILIAAGFVGLVIDGTRSIDDSSKAGRSHSSHASHGPCSCAMNLACRIA